MNKLELLLKERGQIKKIGVIGMGYVGIPQRFFLQMPHVLIKFSVFSATQKVQVIK